MYIPANGKAYRVHFAQGHVLGHQVIPWHNVDPAHLDDDKSLFGNAQDQFEKEANFFSAEVIFQGHRFRSRARDYSASFDAIFYLADQHGVSR